MGINGIEKVKPWYPQIWKVRWLGYRTWHRVGVGPLCFSFYVYPPGQPLGWRGTRLHVSGKTWRYVGTSGVGRHTSSLRRWIRLRKSAKGKSNGN